MAPTLHLREELPKFMADLVDSFLLISPTAVDSSGFALHVHCLQSCRGFHLFRPLVTRYDAYWETQIMLQSQLHSPNSYLKPKVPKFM